MEVTLFMAMSLNGFIAKENGDEDFLSWFNWETACGIAKEHGNYIIGRKTHETIKSYGKDGHGYQDLVGAQGIVISNNTTLKLESNLIQSHSPQEALELLSAKGYKKALVIGGSHVNSAFAKFNLINTIILNIEPYLIGKGLPLFFTSDFERKLKFVEFNDCKNGIVQIKYKVVK